MQEFYYSIPTEVYFGKGQINNLAGIVKKYGKKVLLLYGGGSIKKNGIYDEVVKNLELAEAEIEELSDIEPNPRIETVRKGVELCKNKGIEVLLAVGGGSSIDCAKAVAAGACCASDPWEIALNPQLIQSALPIVCIPTIAATGSEMDEASVISNLDRNEKKVFAHPLLRPKAAIMDPSYTCSVPKYQTASGTADIMSHLFEMYFDKVPGGGYMQKRMIEALLKTCIEYGIRAVNDPNDIEARSNLLWTSSWAINGFLAAGHFSPWSCHLIEHQLSACYDVTHGAGLAVITPCWMKYVLNDKSVDMFADYGRNVWNITGDDCFEIALKAINLTKQYFSNMGLPATLRDLGINDREKFSEMAEKAEEEGTGSSYIPLYKEDIIKILDSVF